MAPEQIVLDPDKLGREKIAICFTSGENEQLPMSVKFATHELTIACSPSIKHVIFPNTSSVNCTFIIRFVMGKCPFSPQVGKIAAVVKSVIFFRLKRNG